MGLPKQSDLVWWITTKRLEDGGKKILGPFESQDLAIRVRTYVEQAENRDGTYWLDSELPR